MRSVPLSEVCKIVNGGTPKSGVADYWGGDVAWLTPAEMGKLRNPQIATTARTITDVGLKNCSARRVPAQSVIMSTRAPIGHLAIPLTPMAFNQGCRGLVPNEKLDTKYLYHFLWFSRDALNELGTGTTFKELSTGALGKFEIPLPPLDEQRRIVAMLDEAFAAIATATANAEQNLANTRAAFRSQRAWLLAGQESWARAQLADLCTIKHGFAFKSEYFTDRGDYVLLTPGNFFEAGGYRDRGPKQKFYEGPLPHGFILEPRSLLVAMTEQAAGLLGSPIQVPSEGRFLHNQRLGLVVPKDGVQFDNEFFYHVFNTTTVREELHRTGTGVKVRHTSPEKIGRLQVSVPPSVADQRDVARQLSTLSGETEQLMTILYLKLKKLDDLKRSLLHRAFSGEPAQQASLAA